MAKAIASIRKRWDDGASAVQAVIVAIYLAMALPVVPLVLGWRRILARAVDPKSWGEAVGLLLVSLSYVWLWAVLVWGSVIAPDYSHLRFVTIYINMAAALGGIILAAVRGVRVRTPLATAAVMLLLLWFYVGVVSSVA